MLKNKTTERYAKALFDLAVEKKQLESFSNELQEIIGLLADYPDLAKIFYHPQIQENDKKQLMRRLLKTTVSPLILNFLMLIIDKGREPFLKEIVLYFQRLAREARGILEVQVYTPLELSLENQTKLISKLGELTGNEVELKIYKDPALIGGLKLRIGDKIIDGSIQRHLESIKENLAQIQVSQLEVS